MSSSVRCEFSCFVAFKFSERSSFRGRCARTTHQKSHRLKLVLIEGAQLDTLAVEIAVNKSLDIKRKLRLTFRTFGIVIPIWRMPLKLPAPAVAKTITERVGRYSAAASSDWRRCCIATTQSDPLASGELIPARPRL